MGQRSRIVGILTLGDVYPANIQISLRFRKVLSEPSFYALWIAKDTRCLHVDNEYSDLTANAQDN